MGTHRRVTELISGVTAGNTVPVVSTGIEIPPVLATALASYGSLWDMEPDQLSYPEDSPIPESWIEVYPQWIAHGIIAKTFYMDPSTGHYWMQKREDPELWREVASADVLQALSLPHVPVSFHDHNQTDTVVQPLWENSKTLSQTDIQAVTLPRNEQIVSVMNLAAQWMVSHRDGHSGNYLAKTVGSDYTVMPIDYGLAWNRGNGMDAPTDITTRETALKWVMKGVKTHNFERNLLLKWVNKGMFRDITDTEWGALESWAATIHDAPSQTWDSVADTWQRATGQTGDEDLSQDMRAVLVERRVYVPDCVRALRVVSQS